MVSCGGARLRNLESALERGLDPFKIVVDRAHEKGIRVLGSIRINDGGAPEGSNYTIGSLKYENPDVMIGEEDLDRTLHRDRSGLRQGRSEGRAAERDRGGLRPLRRGRRGDR